MSRAGTLKQYVRSQTAPREQTRDVLTVVGSTFEELVMASDKDTLIMFRGPDCHMCDELVEELELCYNRIDYQAPDRFQSAIIDATQNDFPGIFKVGALTNTCGKLTFNACRRVGRVKYGRRTKAELKRCPRTDWLRRSVVPSSRLVASACRDRTANMCYRA